MVLFQTHTANPFKVLVISKLAVLDSTQDSVFYGNCHLTILLKPNLLWLQHSSPITNRKFYFISILAPNSTIINTSMAKELHSQKSEARYYFYMRKMVFLLLMVSFRSEEIKVLFYLIFCHLSMTINDHRHSKMIMSASVVVLIVSLEE